MHQGEGAPDVGVMLDRVEQADRQQASAVEDARTALRLYRETAGVTLEAVIPFLTPLRGASRSHVSRFERGVVPWDLAYARALFLAIGRAASAKKAPPTTVAA